MYSQVKIVTFKLVVYLLKMFATAHTLMRPYIHAHTPTYTEKLLYNCLIIEALIGLLETVTLFTILGYDVTKKQDGVTFARHFFFLSF